MPTLNWIGKEKVINHHLDIPYHTLNKEYSFENGELKEEEFSNKIIHADNLLALKSLLPQYEGRIKCIYIDPPYNTGNEGWVYNDNVSDPRFKKWLKTVVGKEGEDLTRHDKWLCMMYPRIKLLHKLLAEDGAIFISIDDNEQASLKLIMDEIFGLKNFVSNVIWQHTIQAKNDVKTVSLQHNYTLIYKKSIFQIGEIERSEEHNVAYSNPDNDPNGLWRSGDVRSPNLRLNLKYEIETPSGKKIQPPEKGWRWDKSSTLEKIEKGEIIFNKEETKIIRKIYLNNQSGRVPESIWFGVDVGTSREANKVLKELFNSNNLFDTPKPTRLIEQIIKLSTDTNSIILDSFAGSGTTAHAVLNLNKQDGGNRKFILIEMEDYAENITAERVKRVINGYGNVEATNGNFSFYTLGERVLDDEQNLNPKLSIEKIHQYIWYNETRNPYTQKATDAGYLGKCNNTGIYFNYKPNEVTIIDDAYLVNVTEPCEQYIMYADMCLLSEKTLLKHNIIFKKIPRDISKL